MYLVLAHFCVSVINNMTPGLSIAMPLHMIFRSVGKEAKGTVYCVCQS